MAKRLNLVHVKKKYSVNEYVSTFLFYNHFKSIQIRTNSISVQKIKADSK